MASCIIPQESQDILLHRTVGFWPWPLLCLQICKCAKRQSAKGRKCRRKGRPQGQLPYSTPPSFYPLKVKAAAQGQCILSVKRADHRRQGGGTKTVREHKIRYGIGWWLGGNLTITRLCTLEAMGARSPTTNCLKVCNRLYSTARLYLIESAIPGLY